MAEYRIEKDSMGELMDQRSSFLLRRKLFMYDDTLPCRISNPEATGFARLRASYINAFAFSFLFYRPAEVSYPDFHITHPFFFLNFSVA